MKNKKQRRKGLNRIDYSYDYDIVEDIAALHTKYINLFIDLHTHHSIVDADFFIAAQQTLTQQYRDELELLRAQERHKTNSKFYLAESRASMLEIYLKRSRRGLFRRRVWVDSPTKEVLDERAEREARGYLEELIGGFEPSREAEEITADKVSAEPNNPVDAEEGQNQGYTDVQDVISNAPDSDCDEVEDDAPDPKDFEIKEGELDELQELEDSHSEEPLDESAELDNVVVEQLPIESAMAFLPMSAESAETSNESAETSGEKAKNEEKDNNEENS